MREREMMAEHFRVMLNARQIRDALAEAVAARAITNQTAEEAVALDVPDGLTVTIVIRNRRAPRKAKNGA